MHTSNYCVCVNLQCNQEICKILVNQFYFSPKFWFSLCTCIHCTHIYCTYSGTSLISLTNKRCHLTSLPANPTFTITYYQRESTLFPQYPIKTSLSSNSNYLASAAGYNKGKTAACPIKNPLNRRPSHLGNRPHLFPITFSSRSPEPSWKKNKNARALPRPESRLEICTLRLNAKGKGQQIIERKYRAEPGRRAAFQSARNFRSTSAQEGKNGARFSWLACGRLRRR